MTEGENHIAVANRLTDHCIQIIQPDMIQTVSSASPNVACNVAALAISPSTQHSIMVQLIPLLTKTLFAKISRIPPPLDFGKCSSQLPAITLAVLFI